MAITASPTASSTSPFSMPGGMPGMGGGPSNLPALNLPGMSMPSVDASKLNVDPRQVFGLLAQQPTSLSNMIGPLLQQVFGAQGNLMQPLFQQQGQQNAAIAQSEAMKRGITGSSVEMGGIMQAYNQANQGYSQYLAQMLQGLVPSFTGAAQFDIGQERNYQTDLAQAIGQQLASQIAQSQFEQMMHQGLVESNRGANAAMIGGGLQGLGSVGGGMAMAGAFSDIRLKDKVLPLGSWRGLTWYAFTYKDRPQLRLPRGVRVGVLGHEVARVRPDCVKAVKGYLYVDYARLTGLKLRSLRVAGVA